jgi:predicted kinase
MKDTLTLLRGLPGAGKTTFANYIMYLAERDPAFPLTVISADDFFTDEDGNYNFNPGLLPSAHAECYERTRQALLQGFDVIVTNTFTTEKELKPYLELAEVFGVQTHVLTVENWHGNSSIHNVPEQTIDKMEQRFVHRLR